jgi:hypothetical protein
LFEDEDRASSLRTVFILILCNLFVFEQPVCAAIFLKELAMATLAVAVQAIAAKGSARPGNNANADILVLVTDPNTGEGVTSLTQADFVVVDHFGIPHQRCGFSNNITNFNNVMTGAYQLNVATHAATPPPGGCKWVEGRYLGQIIVSTSMFNGQAAFLLSV